MGLSCLYLSSLLQNDRPYFPVNWRGRLSNNEEAVNYANIVPRSTDEKRCKIRPSHAPSCSLQGRPAIRRSLDHHPGDFDDFQFSPNTFTIPAGEQITVEAVNTGAIRHDFVIMNFGTTAGDNFDDDDMPNIYWRVDLQPGRIRPRPSQRRPARRVPLICAVEGHLQAGMIGKIIVVAQ
jgi:uncharacterized cupredoxin-like copper-binding protein